MNTTSANLNSAAAINALTERANAGYGTARKLQRLSYRTYRTR